MDEMFHIVEVNGILYIAGESEGLSTISRYDTGNSEWLSPIGNSPSDISAMETDGADLFVAISGASVYRLATNGTELASWSSTNCWDIGSDILSMDVDGSHVTISLEDGGFSIINRSSGVCIQYDTTNGIPTSLLGDVVLNGGKAYVASEDKGVLRYDIANDSWLTPWGSTGVNGVDYAGVAMVGNILHLGLQGYGVVRKDISTGEILTPFLASGRNAPLPSSQIYALASDGSNLYNGT
jgi:hypothetical protein